MFENSLDIARLNGDIALLGLDCIALKAVLRTTWTRPMADEQKRHCVVRRRLTERFVLLAASRGKLHVGGSDALEAHRNISMRLASEYAIRGEVRV